MKQWVITGYDGKNDGILYIVEAETQEEAFKELIKAQPSENNGHYFKLKTNDGYEHDFLIDSNGETDKELKEFIIDKYEGNGGPRRFWELYISEFSLNTNLHAAVSW